MGLFDGIGGALTGGILSYFGQEETNRSNAQMAQSAQQASALEASNNRAWQKMMSDTAYQRAVKDMEAAGLNPMLAYQNGGASSPSGATGMAFQAQMGNSLGSAVEGFNRSRATGADVEQKASDTELKGTQNELTKESIKKIEADIKVAEATAKNIDAGTLAKLQEARTGSAAEAKYRSDVEVNQAQRAKDKATAPLYNLLEQGTSYIKEKVNNLHSAFSSSGIKRREDPRNITIYGNSK